MGSHVSQPATLHSVDFTQTLEAPVPDGYQSIVYVPEAFLHPLLELVVEELPQLPGPLAHLDSEQLGSQTTHFPDAVSTSDPASQVKQFSTLSHVLQFHSALHLKQIPCVYIPYPASQDEAFSKVQSLAPPALQKVHVPEVFLKYPGSQPSQAEAEVQVVHPPGHSVQEVTGDPDPKYPSAHAEHVAAVVASPAVAYPHPVNKDHGVTQAPLLIT